MHLFLYDMDKNRFDELINLYLLDKLTDPEGVELAGMLQLPGYQAAFERLVLGQMEQREFDLELPPESVHARIQDYLDREIGVRPAPVRRAAVIKRPLWRYAAVVLLVVAGTYIYQRLVTPGMPPGLLSQEKRFKNDIRPGGRKATLTLADGSRMLLTDSLGLPAGAETAKTGEVQISTGMGQTYSLILADGTKVWLNSLSALRCPLVFTGSRRMVQLSGEAYFEVVHNAKMPFSVRLPDGSQVKDLGTCFNIHAYSDEPVIKTTLFEGAVQVEDKGREISLAPGEEERHSAKGKPELLKVVNLPGTVAWKEDEFILDGTCMQAIMQEVQRWYGAEIVFADNMQHDTTAFYGSLPRNVPVSKLLRLLELTGQAHFTIEGKKITVMK